MRTAACSALSARLLAREDAAVLAVLGTGVQARAHVEAVQARAAHPGGADRRPRPRPRRRRSRRSSAPSPRVVSRTRSRAPTSSAPARHSPDPVVRGAVARAGNARDVGRVQPARAARSTPTRWRARSSSSSRGPRRSRRTRPARTISCGRSATARSATTTSTPRSASWSPARGRAGRRPTRSRSTSRSASPPRTPPRPRSSLEAAASAWAGHRDRDLAAAHRHVGRPGARELSIDHPDPSR